MKKTYLAGLISATLISAATAMPTDGGYFGVGFGQYFTDNARHMTDSMGLNVTGGYQINSSIAAQAILLMMGPSNTDGTGSQHDNSYFLGLEGLVSVPTQGKVNPFIGFGLGDLKITSTEFAPDVILGVADHLTSSFSMNLSLRHFIQITGPDAYNDNYLSVGATWSFGGSNALPAAQTAPVTQLSSSQVKALNAAKKELKDYLPQGVHQCGHDGATPETGCVTLNGDQVTMHLNVRFVKAKADVQGQYTPAIDKLGKFMNQYPTTQATLFGYASADGVLSFNQKLSLWRAQNVKSYLVKHDHIHESRLKTVGMGIQDPIASNKTNEGRALNRRVEAAVTVNVPH